MNSIPDLNERVRVGKERGFYWVRKVTDTTVTVYGGSKDPNGLRRTRTVPLASVRPDTRTLEAKYEPGWKGDVDK
jgi:hypothetical protein